MPINMTQISYFHDARIAPMKSLADRSILVRNRKCSVTDKGMVTDPLPG